MTVAKSKRTKSAAQQLRFLHWLMASFYLVLFVVGNYMNSLSRDVSYRMTLFDFHRTLGVIVMCLLLARVFVLLRTLQHKHRRRQPERTGNWLRTFALHTVLYFFMLLVPLSGYFSSNTDGFDVIVFGTGIALPKLFVTNEQLAELGDSAHFWLAYTFLAFIVLHMVVQKKYLRAQVRRFFKPKRLGT